MNRTISLPVAILGLISATVTTLPAASLDVFYTDFENGTPAGFSPGPLTSRVSSEGYALYGFGSYMLISQGGTNTGNAVTLTLTGLPAHTSVELDFLLAIINSWDGWAPQPIGHDLFNVEIDGVSVSRNHFSNLWLGDMVNPPPGTGIIFQTNNVGFPAGQDQARWPDSAYRMTLRALPHTGSTLTIRWYADGNGWQGGTEPTDEFWGIDNLRVRLNNVSQAVPIIATQPAPQTVPAGGIATFSVSASAQPAPQFFWFREGGSTVLGVGSSLSFGPVSAGDAGGYYVVVSNALGSVASVVAQLTLTGNQPPLKNSPLPDQSLAAGSSFNFTVPADTFIDPDVGQTLTWSVGLLPAGLAFNPATRTFSGVPVAGVHWITVTATDDGTPASSISDTFRLTVTGSSLYEGFDYPAGTAILTRNGGTGWAGPWYNGTYTNAASSLSYPGIPVTGGRAVALPNSVQARRPIHPSVFAPPAPGALPTKYFSVLMRADGALNGWCAIDLVGTAGRALSIGKPFGGQTGMYVLETGPQQTPSTYPVVSGSNALLVVKCEFFSGNDRFTLYVNPVPGEPPPPPAATKFDHDVGTTFTNLMISSSIACSIDELRVGDTFAEVVPALCPPVFLAQPTNTTAAIGLPLVLSAPAAGQGPIAYQWRKDGVPLLNNGPITGADTGTLVIPLASMTDSGNYDVVVSSPCDTLTSQVATVAVQGLAFVTQPLSQAVRPGNNATFSVTVSSASPVTYQWQFNGVNIENATNPTLTVPNAQAAQRGNYRCIAHNNLGDFPSAEAYLEVMVAPTFVEQPQNLTVAVGANATFTAAVTNTASVPILFTLRKGSTPLNNPPPQTVMGTSVAFTLASVQLADAGSYRIVATNIAGQLTASSPATLTVMDPPIITVQPLSVQVAAGASASFSVTATGGAPLTYQWRRNGNNLNDATNSTLLISAVAAGDAGDYTVVVSNPVGLVTSAVAVLSLEQVVVPLVVSPAVTNVLTGGTVAFAVSGGAAPYAFALAANGSGGNITPAGHYTAGSAAGLDLVQVTDADGSNATAIVTVLGCTGLAYEAALNSLPSAQGWTHQSSGAAEANYALTGGALLQGDTAPAEQTQFYQSAGVAFDFTTQTVVAEARVRINQSELIAPGTSPAPRAGWGLQLIDSAGRFVTLFVGGSGYFLLGQNDQASALMSLDATAAFHTFRLVANSAGASVSVDGVPQASLNFSQFRLDGMALANSLILGDLTGSAASSSQVTRFHVATLCPPPPLVLTPDATNTVSGGAVTFTATGGTPPYTFTLTTNHSGGSVTAAGNYTAGPGCGADTLVLTDSAGSNAPATILVSDATPPVVACPEDITVEAATPAGTTVDFVVTASDACTAHPILIVSPPSGSEFPAGTNIVTCQATDEAGNIGSCTFQVVVRDTRPPVISCPGNIAVSSLEPGGAAVTFVATATDAVDQTVPVTCAPASGATFSVGTTPVQCTATDAAGNSSSCSFTVTVTHVTAGFGISGMITDSAAQPVAGVEVRLSGSDGKAFAITDAGGNFSFPSLADGNYTLDPNHRRYVFDPPMAEVTVAGSAVVYNFSAQQTGIAIRGRVLTCVDEKPVEGARVYATGVRQPAFTDSQGNYVLPAVPAALAITVHAEKSGFAFQPAAKLVGDPTRDAVVDFCAEQRVRVTGLVLDGDGVGIDDATVTVGGSVISTAVTRQGRFGFSVPMSATVNLTPSKSRFVFTPASHSIANLGQDVSVQFRGVELPGNELSGKLAVWPWNQPGTRESPAWGHVHVLNDNGDSAPTTLGRRMETRVAAIPPEAVDFAWSRDGRRLAFSYDSAIQIMENDGRNLRRLTPGAGVRFSPAWSPDGSMVAYIAFERFSGTYSYGLMIIGANGSNPSPINTPFNEEPIWCTWSPDGIQITFVSQEGRLYHFERGGPGFLELPLRTGERVRSVAWSPDGTRLAYVSWYNGAYDVHIVSPDGTTHFASIPGARAMAWSPDGTRLAIQQYGAPGIRTVKPDGTDPQELPHSEDVNLAPHCWGRLASFETPRGVNSTVGSASASVTFANVQAVGNTTILPIPVDSAVLPPGYFSLDGATAFQIKSTARNTGPITVCLQVPEAISEDSFNRLRLFHGENGVLVDRTILPPESPAPDYATRTICARVTSLSPFVLAEQIDPALPQITGLVVDTNGNAIADAFVTLSGAATNLTRTDLAGRFALWNLSTSGNYAVSVARSGYGFSPPLMSLSPLGIGADILFVGTNAPPVPMPPLTISPDARFGNQPTLTWPGLLYEFQLESTDSLDSPDWGIAPELQLPVETGTAVPLNPAGTQRFFRLRQP